MSVAVEAIRIFVKLEERASSRSTVDLVKGTIHTCHMFLNMPPNT